jgi:hypothetical protein
MYTTVLAALLVAPAADPAKHEDQNALFKRLIETGFDGGKEKIKLPKPTMPDGLDAAKQSEIIKAVVGKEIELEEFTRDSVVARVQMKIRLDVPGGDAKAPVRGVDVWFITYGDFKLLEDDKFLDKFTGANKSSGQGAPLKKADLDKRKIEVKDEKREGYGTFQFDFLEKVRLSGVGHAMWSRGAESVVAAAEIDPRFANDEQFPNRWRPITKAGEVKIGDPHPWGGAAMYLKITKLKEPAGAMFIEQHIVFTEPVGWFDGTTLLTSKLPPAVTTLVRDMRKEFVKGK